MNNTVTGLSRGVLLSVADKSVIRDNRFEDIEQGFSVISAPYSSVEKNIFNVTQTGGIVDTGTGSQNTTIADNRISGYETTGIQVNEPEGTVLSNNTLCRKDNAWDIYLNIPQEEYQYDLVLEENTVGVAHPTTFTITEPNNPVFIRSIGSSTSISVANCRIASRSVKIPINLPSAHTRAAPQLRALSCSNVARREVSGATMSGSAG